MAGLLFDPWQIQQAWSPLFPFSEMGMMPASQEGLVNYKLKCFEISLPML